MIDIGAITGAATGLSKAMSIANALLKLKIDIEVKQQITELVGELGDVTGKFTAAQIAYSAAQMRVNELEKEIATLKGRVDEKERYQLVKLKKDFVYMLKGDKAKGEPAHCLCPMCFEIGIKTFLREPRDSNDYYLCRKCECGFGI